MYIVKRENFTVKRYSRIFFDWKQTGTLSYNILLPFNTKVEYDPSKHNCIGGKKELSEWFTDESRRKPDKN